jgi:hypothetical protein
VIGVRLQAGPCDGQRASIAELERDGWMDPGRLWARPCPLHGADWSEDPIDGWELYVRDEEDARGWLVYTFEDENLGRHDQVTQSVLVLTGAEAEG